MNRLNSTTRRRKVDRQRSRGLTLIELLLALGLSLVLMSSILSAIHLLGRISTTTDTAVTTTQLMNAILLQVERDLLASSFSPRAEVDEAEFLVDDSGSSASSDADTTAETGEMSFWGVAGITGDPQSLVIQSDIPAHAHRAVAAGLSADLSSQRSVAYFLVGSNNSALAASVADLWTSNGSPPVRGLARLDGPRSLVQSVDERGDVQTLARLSSIVADEVTSLNFRYFDGANWYETWNSGEAGSLPVAVEITLGVRRSGTDTTRASAETTPIDNVTSDGVKLQRHVVRIPTAVYVPTTSTSF